MGPNMTTFSTVMHICVPYEVKMSSPPHFKGQIRGLPAFCADFWPYQEFPHISKIRKKSLVLMATPADP